MTLPAGVIEHVYKSFGFLKKEGFQLETVHLYSNMDGDIEYYKCRFKNPENKQKQFRYFHKNGDGFVNTKPKRVDGDLLFNISGIKNADVVVFVEGEKTAESLIKIGVPATTTGGKALSEHTAIDLRVLAGKRVIVWPDADAGDEFAAVLAKKLGELGCQVSQVDVVKAGLTGKEDAVEWLEKHPNALPEDVYLLPKKEIKVEVEAGYPVVLSLDKFLGLKLPEKDKVFPWLVARGNYLVFAWRGVGKTFFSLGCAYALATGSKFLVWEASRKMSVLYVDGEMSGIDLQDRLSDLVQSSGMGIPSNFRVFTPDLQSKAMPNIGTKEGQKLIEAAAKDCELVIIDNLSCLLRSEEEENASESWDDVQEWALKLKREGKTTIFIHHAGKAGKQRGTSKKEDIMDEVIELREPKDKEEEDGCYFEVHYRKRRHIHGKEAEPFSARLRGVRGSQFWEIKSMKETLKETVRKLWEEDYTQTEIAKKLEIAKGTVSKYLKELKESEVTTWDKDYRQTEF